MKSVKYLLIGAAVSLPVLGFMNQARAEVVTKTYTYSSDKNGDGFITADEFNTYVYQRSDLNADGFLASDEWDVSTSQWYKPYDVKYESYTYWDQDKDSRLDSNEAETLVEKTGLYSKWDTNVDTKLSGDEFAAGTFKAYDDNGDGNISLIEWQDVLR